MEHFENNYVSAYYENIVDGQQFRMYIRPRNRRVKRIGQLSSALRCPHCGGPMHICDMAFSNDGKRATHLCQSGQGYFVTTNIFLIAGAMLAQHQLAPILSPRPPLCGRGSCCYQHFQNLPFSMSLLCELKLYWQIIFCRFVKHIGQ